MESITQSNSGSHPDLQTRVEVLYDGYYYDVTYFLQKHPGGSVIKFYTEPGEDATSAIDQFHFRSRHKVQLMLKSFRRRPANMDEVCSDKKTNTKHQELNVEFTQLFEQLLAEGYFEPSIPHVILRFIEALAWELLAVGLFLDSSSYLGKAFACLLCGFAGTRFGWFMHEGGHNSLTGSPKMDKFLQAIATCWFIGGSAAWWNSQHNRHHAMPQRLHHDVDLGALPLLAFNERVVTNKSQINSLFMKYQGVLYWTVDLFLGVLLYKFYINPRCQLRKGQYFEIVLNIFTYYMMLGAGPGWYLLGLYFWALIFAFNFSLSHSHLEVADKPTHWVEYSLTHTANIQPSMLCDWWMGYLNYQIEHHLFPTMPQFRQREICHRVRALAEKHDLRYTVYGFWEASRLAAANLYNVGVNLSEKDWDVHEGAEADLRVPEGSVKAKPS